jgi:hypothetical protein
MYVLRTPYLSVDHCPALKVASRMSMVLLLSLTWPCQGQVVQGFGLKLGPTSSSIGDYEFGDVHRRKGLAVLGFVEWFDARVISVVTEVGYVQRGFEEGPHQGRDEQNLPTGTYMLNTRFDYLTSALLAKLEPIQGRVTPYAVIGPRVDFYLGGDTSFDSDAIQLPGIAGGFLGIDEEYRGLAFGGTAGLGLEVPVSRAITLMLEVRLNLDVSNSLPDVLPNSRNNAFDVLLGIRL